MQLSKYEQETIITYNEDEQTAGVYTHNRSLRRKLDGLAEERPQECRIEKAGDYTVPKSWIRVTPPRKSVPMSEEHKEKLIERLSAARKGQ